MANLGDLVSRPKSTANLGDLVETGVPKRWDMPQVYGPQLPDQEARPEYQAVGPQLVINLLDKLSGQIPWPLSPYDEEPTEEEIQKQVEFGKQSFPAAAAGALGKVGLGLVKGPVGLLDLPMSLATALAKPEEVGAKTPLGGAAKVATEAGGGFIQPVADLPTQLKAYGELTGDPIARNLGIIMESVARAPELLGIGTPKKGREELKKEAVNRFFEEPAGPLFGGLIATAPFAKRGAAPTKIGRGSLLDQVKGEQMMAEMGGRPAEVPQLPAPKPGRPVGVEPLRLGELSELSPKEAARSVRKFGKDLVKVEKFQKGELLAERLPREELSSLARTLEARRPKISQAGRIPEPPTGSDLFMAEKELPRGVRRAPSLALREKLTTPMKSARESAEAAIDFQNHIDRLNKSPIARKGLKKALYEERLDAWNKRWLPGKYGSISPGAQKVLLDAAKKVGPVAGAAGITAGLLAFMDDDEKTKQALAVGLFVTALRPFRSVIKRVKVDGNMFTRPIRRIKDSPAGLEAKDMAVRFFDLQKEKNRYNVVIEDVIHRHYGRTVVQKAPRLFSRMRDYSWMKKNFKQLIENPDKVKAPNKAIAEVADAWRQVAGDLGRQLKELGHTVRDIRTGKSTPFELIRGQRYFPHNLTDKANLALTTKVGDFYQALKEEAHARGFDADMLVQLRSEKYNVRRVGSADYRRISDFPDQIKVGGKMEKVWETNPFKAMPRYIDGVSRRIAMLKLFGPDKVARAKGNRIYNDLLSQEGSVAANTWHDWWLDMNGFPVDLFNKGHWAFKGYDVTLGQLARLSQLSLAAVKQFGSYYAIASMTSPRAFLYGFLNSLRNPEKVPRLAEARRWKAWAYDTLADTYAVEDISGAVGAVTKKGLEAVLMNRSNRHINKVGSLAGMYDLERGMEAIRLGKPGTIKNLWGISAKEYTRTLKRAFDFKDADITRMAKEGPKSADFGRAAYKMSERTNLFTETALVRPRWMSKYAFRQIMAYVSPARAFGNVLSDALVAVKGGNIKPLTTFLFGGAVTGEIMYLVGNFLSDKEREEKNYLVRLFHDLTMAGSLGLLGELAQRIEYTIGRDEPPATVITPPPWSVGEEFLKTIIDIAGDKDVTTGERVQRGAQRSAPLYRALYRNYNRWAGGDAYLAERLKYSIYLEAGRNTKGEWHEAGEAKPDFMPQTTKMLMTRATSPQAILRKIRHERMGKRLEKAKGQGSLKEATVQQSAERMAVQERAEDLVAKMDSSTSEKRKMILGASLKRDKSAATQALKIIQDRSLGLSPDDRQLRTLSVTSGARARYIVSQMNKMSKDESVTYLQDLKKKKILTPDVAKQIMTLLQGKP